MYLLLSLLCCLGFVPLMGTMGPSSRLQWLMLAPFLAANGFAAWTGWRGGRAYPAALTAVCVDLTAGMFGLWTIAVSAASYSRMLSFIPVVATGVGVVVALMVERSAGVFSSALPVRGEWGRRFLAGFAVLLLQPASPGVLCLAPALLTQRADVSSHWIALWLITAVFYLTPVYRRIVSGVPAHVDLSRSHAQATTLAEFLAADAVTNPNVSRSFARFVVRCERTIYKRLRETGREPDNAGRRCRGLLRELWFDKKRYSYEDLEVEHLQTEIEDPDGPSAPVGCERLLLDLALVDLPPSVQAMTTEWVETGNDHFALKTAAGLHRSVVSRRVHLGIGEALSRIALALPARAGGKAASQGSRTDGESRR